MKKRIVITASVVIAVLCVVLFSSCSNNNEALTETTEPKTFKEQMDIAMQNADDNTVLASVNGVEITQTNKDVYLISGEDYSIEELVKMFVIADFAEKQGLEINQNAKNRIDSLRTSMETDDTINEEYCVETYGISKEQVIEYMVNRSKQIWLNSAFSDMVIEQVSSGECPKIYPSLQTAYDKFEKDKLSKGSKAWDDIENAYYEMIVQDYEIVIY